MGALRKSLKKQKCQIAKMALIFRFVLIFGVISIFYLSFLLMPQEGFENQHQQNENFWISSPAKRKLFSVDLVEREEIGNCSKPAILEFPSDGFTREQRLHGWIILHIVAVFYGFCFLAAVCDDYLVPSIEQICSNLNIDRDVIGATVMAAAVSSPELFMNCIGTFITKGDIGVSSIVGSAVFNILAVPACCGLFVANYIKLDWWPITRDCLVYLVAVLTLLGIVQDGKVMWYEALGLTLAYFIYMLVMYRNQKMACQAKRFVRRWFYKPSLYHEVSELTPLKSGNNNDSQYSLANDAYLFLEQGLRSSHVMIYLEHQEKEESISSPWSRAADHSMVEFIFRWPITLILWLTVPNCRSHRGSLKYLTLILAFVWISIISYLVAFAVTIIGDTLHIPDAVMGLTILAAGMSIPEAVSSVIVTKQGQASMGLSNSLGSNTFDVLLSLGLPWFIKSYFLPDQPQQLWVSLNTDGLTYIMSFLLTSLLGLYLVFVLNRFNLNRKVGIWCLGMYIVFMISATLVELNVFFPLNLPTCQH